MNDPAQMDLAHETYHKPDWSSDRVCRICGKPWGGGSRHTNGTVGAPGRLTHVSETLDLPPIAASTTRDAGLRDYPGRVTGILSRSKGEQAGEYTLTVCFDSQTERRLRERAFGSRGPYGTVGVGFSLTMRSGERFTT